MVHGVAELDTTERLNGTGLGSEWRNKVEDREWKLFGALYVEIKV